MEIPPDSEQRSQTSEEMSANIHLSPFPRFRRNSLLSPSLDNDHNPEDVSEVPLISVPDIALEIVLSQAAIGPGVDQMKVQLQAAVSGDLKSSYPGNSSGMRMDSDVRITHNCLHRDTL